MLQQYVHLSQSCRNEHQHVASFTDVIDAIIITHELLLPLAAIIIININGWPLLLILHYLLATILIHGP
jgi:hypothetical protein